MSDQSPGRPGRRPRRWSRTSLVVAGTVTVAAVASVGLALAGGGHGTDASLLGKVTTPTKAPLTPASASRSSSVSSPSRPPSSAQAPARVPARTSAPPSSASVAAPAPAAASPSAAAPWVSTSCPSQLLSWRGTGASGQLQVVVTKLTIVSQAATALNADLAAGTAPAAAVTALRSAAASLSSATQAAGKNVIPDCVSAAHQAEVAGLADLNRAATGFGSAADKSASGDLGGARGGVQTAVTAVQSGSAEVATAIVAVSQYGTK